LGFGFPGSVSPQTVRTIDAAAATPRLRAHPNSPRSSSETHRLECGLGPTANSHHRSGESHGDSQAPLVQFLQRPPLHRQTNGASTQDRSPGDRLPSLPHVPLLPFLTTPAVCSAPTGVGLLHPTADHEVHPVSSRPPTVADNTTLLTGANPPKPFPPDKVEPVTPSEIGPKTAPGEVHRSPCPSRWFATRTLVPSPKRWPVDHGAPPSGV
jgi:hypothetical protein